MMPSTKPLSHPPSHQETCVLFFDNPLSSHFAPLSNQLRSVAADAPNLKPLMKSSHLSATVVFHFFTSQMTGARCVSARASFLLARVPWSVVPLSRASTAPTQQQEYPQGRRQKQCNNYRTVTLLMLPPLRVFLLFLFFFLLTLCDMPRARV